MRLIGFAVLAAACLAATSTLAQQKPDVDAKGVVATKPGKGAAAARTVRVSASVEAIDKQNRVVTLKGPRGNVFDLAVGPDVKNFDQIQVGDFLVVRYAQALTLELKKGGGGVRSRTEGQDAVKANPGARPGAAGARQVKVVADITAVNAKQQTITLKGPKQSVEMKVHDPEMFKTLKVGDQVEATYTEAAAITIEPAKKPEAKK